MHDRQYTPGQVEQVRYYLKFLLSRARGETKTGARLIRDFVLSHPNYKHDSIVSNEIAFDLVKSIINYSNIDHNTTMSAEKMFKVIGITLPKREEIVHSTAASFKDGPKLV